MTRPGPWWCGVLGMALAGSGGAQTRLDLGRQAQDVDFTGAALTKPFRAGPTLPVSCSVNEAFLQAGTLYLCTSANHWQPAMSGFYQTPIAGAPGTWPFAVTPANGTWCASWAGGTPSWVTCSGGGGGSLSSVGLSMSSLPWLSVSNSPLTASGNIALAPAAGQPSHQVIGTCGSATSFGPCPLTASDIPSLNYQAPIATGSTAQYLRGDLSLAAFPTTWAWSALTGVPSTFNAAQMLGVAIPGFSAGHLYYNGSVLSWDNTAYLTGNQTITLTASGDVSGGTSGATSLSPALTVTGIRGSSVPSLTSGVLRYVPGTGLTWDNSTYLTGNQTITISGVCAGSGTTSISLACAVPAATPTTLGGLFSASSVAHKWVAYIDNTGTQQQTQPAFSDLAGSPTAAQIAGAGTLTNNTSGNAGTATALAATPGQCTSGQFATGIAANGTANCSAPGGSGNVTASGMATGAMVTATGTTLIQTPNANATMDSSGNISTPGTISSGVGSGLAGLDGLGAGTQTIPGSPANLFGWIGPATGTGQHLFSVPNAGAAAHQFMVFGAESSGVSSASLTSLSSLLDTVLGSTQGSVLYRGSSVWAALAPGTSGYVLESQGAGANPQWVVQSGGGGSGNPYISTFTCSTTPTTITAATHGQGSYPFLRFTDATHFAALPGSMTLASNGDVTVTCGVSVSLTAYISGAVGSHPNIPQTFASATSVVVYGINHDFGNPYVRAQVWDNASPRNWIIPGSVSTDSTTFDTTISFSSSVSGLAILASN